MAVNYKFPPVIYEFRALLKIDMWALCNIDFVADLPIFGRPVFHGRQVKFYSLQCNSQNWRKQIELPDASRHIHSLNQLISIERNWKSEIKKHELQKDASIVWSVIHTRDVTIWMDTSAMHVYCNEIFFSFPFFLFPSFLSINFSNFMHRDFQF